MLQSSLSSPDTGYRAGHSYHRTFQGKSNMQVTLQATKIRDKMQKGSAGSLAGHGWGSDPAAAKAQMFVSSPECL